jgi:hypothetical protein
MSESNPYVGSFGVREYFGTPGKPKSRGWLERRRKDPKFPKPFFFYGSDRPHWRIAWLEQYAEACATESNAA